MCLIIASSTGKRISDKILEDAARTNSHGAGIAWSEKGKILFKKGLDVNQISNILDSEAKDKPWVTHFRIATVGGQIPELTHPFTIDARASVEEEGEADSVLFQNGTFGNWKEYLLQASASSGKPVPEAPWSDTRAIAFLCHVYGKHMLSLLDNNSRFLVFDAKDTTDRRMMLWGEWHDHEKFKFSNRFTQSWNSSGNHQSSGSSSSNFPRAGAEDESAAGSGTATNTSTNPNDTSPATSNDSSKSSTALVVSSRLARSTGTKTPFQVKPGYDYWRHFDHKGVYVKADNEGAPTV